MVLKFVIIFYTVFFENNSDESSSVSTRSVFLGTVEECNSGVGTTSTFSEEHVDDASVCPSTHPSGKEQVQQRY